jgi:flavodoxin
MKLFAVYFSGTGNTKYAVERFLTHFPGSEAHSIEEPIDFLSAARSFDMILVAHPIYGSEMPLLMRDFLRGNQALFENKDLVTLVTQYLFSGDGCSLAFRLVRKQIRTHLASLHVNMPVNLNVPPFFTVKNGAENGKKLSKANQTIDRCAEAVDNASRVKKGRASSPSCWDTCPSGCGTGCLCFRTTGANWPSTPKHARSAGFAPRTARPAT